MTENPRGQASRRKVPSSEVEAGGMLESASNIFLGEETVGDRGQVGPGCLEDGASDI